MSDRKKKFSIDDILKEDIKPEPAQELTPAQHDAFATLVQLSNQRLFMSSEFMMDTPAVSPTGTVPVLSPNNMTPAQSPTSALSPSPEPMFRPYDPDAYKEAQPAWNDAEYERHTMMRVPCLPPATGFPGFMLERAWQRDPVMTRFLLEQSRSLEEEIRRTAMFKMQEMLLPLPQIDNANLKQSFDLPRQPLNPLHANFITTLNRNNRSPLNNISNIPSTCSSPLASAISSTATSPGAAYGSGESSNDNSFDSPKSSRSMNGLSTLFAAMARENIPVASGANGGLSMLENESSAGSSPPEFEPYEQSDVRLRSLRPPSWCQRQNYGNRRSRYSPELITYLEAKFAEFRFFAKREDMEQISKETGLTHAQVKTWFQNRRYNMRTKKNKRKNE